ncbi:MAG: methyltransferase domain-containing protein [Aquabacterium sp.]|nr:methyltransferase domain-containing protein [Aquabacterium sp.]
MPRQWGVTHTAPPSTAFDQAKAEFLAGLASHQAGDFAMAQAHYEASLRLLPGRPSTLINLAATQLRRGHPEAALATADAALAIDPTAADALLHRGTALAQLGRAPEALVAFERLTMLEPAHPLAWSHRGSLLREMHRHQEATAAFREALRHGADPELHRYYLAGLGAEAAPSAPPRDYVERLFDNYADDFDTHLLGTLGYQAHRELVGRVRRCADPGGFDVALDLGCGTGLCGPLLRPLARHLTGLDLSSAMLGRSRTTGAYDRLEQADATQFLAATSDRFDLMVAADVLIYIGDPGPLFAAAQRAMQRGLFAFTVEATDDGGAGPGWRLLPSLRYAHSRPHLLGLAQAHGFEPVLVEQAQVRHDQGQAVDGLYMVLRRLPTAAPR